MSDQVKFYPSNIPSYINAGAMILASVLGGLVSGSGVFIYFHDQYNKVINSETALKLREEVLKTDVKSLQDELAFIENREKLLNIKYATLEARHLHCFSTNKVKNIFPFQPETWFEYNLNKGDSIYFTLDRSEVNFKLTKVAENNVTFEILGCPKFSTAGVSVIENENTLSISSGKMQELTLSSECCDQGFDECELKYTIVVHFKILQLDEDNQNASLKIKKSLNGGE